MRKLNETFYEIREGEYAEFRDGAWFVTNEAAETLAGPFPSLERLEAHLAANSDDLMSLRQASKHLPVSYQALYAARGRGTLPAPRRVDASEATPNGRVELYSLAELRERYEGQTVSERISAGMRAAHRRKAAKR